MNTFCPLFLPIQVKPALTKGKAVPYTKNVSNISPHDMILCKCQPLAASTNQDTHADLSTTSTSPSSYTPTPTEPAASTSPSSQLSLQNL
ncbi:hypothetical protein BD770DRAFT_396058 [Pilaira anomala]|nr:hypothetical protein BD770DRAFT_396058 [Pilaira anomala]